MWVFAIFVHPTAVGIMGMVWVLLRHAHVTQNRGTIEKVKVTVFTIFFPTWFGRSAPFGILISVLRGAVDDYL